MPNPRLAWFRANSRIAAEHCDLLRLKLSGFLLNAFIVAVCLAIFWHR